jgi:hypothetical protein
MPEPQFRAMIDALDADTTALPPQLRRPRDAHDQPLPTPNDGPSIHDLVAADIAARKALGTSRYGTFLQPHNGRDSLLDAYQEALDLACYLRQAIAERDSS